ncbi:MAG: calcium-binding EGF-like domain-containing protein, partial [Myxococcota bacterium]
MMTRYLVVAALVCAGCSGSDDESGGDEPVEVAIECIEGRSVSCACSDGRGGSQTCTSDGTFGSCECTGAPDVDACAAAPCDANATCFDLVNSFACVCNTGFVGNGQICNLDECAASLDDCDINATCTDSAAGFQCGCNPGWSGDGTTCQDVDECAADSDNCDANAECINRPGGFDCTCLDGFSGDGVTCTPTPVGPIGDLSVDPASFEISGIGTYAIGGMSRLGWDFGVIETPVTNYTHKDAGAFSIPDLVVTELAGTPSQISG